VRKEGRNTSGGQPFDVWARRKKGGTKGERGKGREKTEYIAAIDENKKGSWPDRRFQGSQGKALPRRTGEGGRKGDQVRVILWEETWGPSRGKKGTPEEL